MISNKSTSYRYATKIAFYPHTRGYLVCIAQGKNAKACEALGEQYAVSVSVSSTQYKGKTL
jgi:hypothetical protein